jgi:hypothetical protein
LSQMAESEYSIAFLTEDISRLASFSDPPCSSGYESAKDKRGWAGDPVGCWGGRGIVKSQLRSSIVQVRIGKSVIISVKLINLRRTPLTFLFVLLVMHTSRH